MRNSLLVLILSGVLSILCNAMLFLRPYRWSGVISIIICLELIIIAVITIFAALARQRKVLGLTLLATVMLIAFVMSLRVRPMLLERYFFAHAQDYETSVKTIDSTLRAEQPLRTIEISQPGLMLGFSILAAKSTNDGVMVEYHLAGGFPVKHSGIIYVASDRWLSSTQYGSRWSILREITNRWYYFSD